jgi:hypothetical protein
MRGDGRRGRREREGGAGGIRQKLGKLIPNSFSAANGVFGW